MTMGNKPLSPEQVQSIRRMLDTGISRDIIARQMDLTLDCVGGIARGQTYSGNEGADPFPGLIRRALERERRKGLAFPIAWANALELHPAPWDWRSKTGGDGASPLEFAKHIFARAYARIPLMGDVAVPDTAPTRTPRAATKPGRSHCRWGGGCKTTVTGGRRFCAEHRDVLAAIALKPYEGSRDHAVLAAA